jgi:hypothetical protein
MADSNAGSPSAKPWTEADKLAAVDDVLNYLGIKSDNPRRETVKKDVKCYIAGSH